MRPFLLFIFLLLASLSQSFGQEYLPLIKKGRETYSLYYYSRFGPTSNGYFYNTLHTSISRDSLIEGRNYLLAELVNFDAFNVVQTIRKTPFREDSLNRKIYFFHPVTQQDVLFFDCSANVGDTISISREWISSYFDTSSTQTSYREYKVRIENFDSLRLGNLKLKRTKFRSVDQSVDLTFDLFVEGIGFSRSVRPIVEGIYHDYLMQSGICCTASLVDLGITCISDPSGRLNYTNPQYDSCVIYGNFRWPLSTAKKIQKKALEVYPNPTAGELKVKGLESLSSETAAVLIDAQGKTVWQGWLSAENATVPMSLQPRGLYLLQVGGNSTKVLKD